MSTAGAGECEVDGRRREVWGSGAQAGREQGVARWQDAGGWSIGAQVRECGGRMRVVEDVGSYEYAIAPLNPNFAYKKHRQKRCLIVLN